MHRSGVVAGMLVVMVLLSQGCQTSDIGEPCMLETKPSEGLLPGDVIIETNSVECEAHTCLAYNGSTFCTARCDVDEDCEDLGGEDRAYCEAEIVVGGPEALGSYCVPEYASTSGR